MESQPSPQVFVDQATRTYRAGEFTQAAEAFAQAAQAYAEKGDSLMAAEMQNNQSVALLRAKDARGALAILQGTEQVFAGAGDARRQGMALANRAAALQVLKRYKESIESYKQAGDALQKAGEMNLRVDVMQQLSWLYLRRFKFYDALVTLQSGLAGVKDLNFKQRLMKKILFIRL